MNQKIFLVSVMIKCVVIFSVFIFLIHSVTDAQKINTPADKFFTFFNNYETDSLKTLLADSFLLKRTYTSYTNNKLSFLKEYIPYSRSINAKFELLQISTDTGASRFLALDKSDNLKYLGVKSPKWIITIEPNIANEVQTVIIDSTEGFQNYLNEIQFKQEAFENWLKNNYPDDSWEKLYNDKEGLLIKRLKEYSERK